jgi:outer membrane lipoprotein-sorting protein
MSVGRGTEPEPETSEHVVRVWLDGTRAREEREGLHAFPALAVRDGDRWWMYSPEHGASSNEADPDVGSGVGEAARHLLDPAFVVAVLHLRLAGAATAAGRDCIRLAGTPRETPDHGFALHRFGFGADEVDLLVDRERGVLLRAEARFEGEPFSVAEVTEVAFDESFPPETFTFELPPGETFGPVFSRPRHMTLAQAAATAPFTVLGPERVPEGWRLMAIYMPLEERPPMPASVNLLLHAEDASAQVNIRQTAAAYDEDDWFEWETVGEAEVAGEASPSGTAPGYARVERHGTRATLSSAELERSALVALAESLRPASPEPPALP